MKLFSLLFLTLLTHSLVAATATGVYNGCPNLDFTWHTNIQNIINYSMDITDISQVQDNLFEITIHVTGSQQIPLKYLYSLKVIGVNGPKGTVQLYGKNENTYLIDNPTDFTTTFEIYATLTDCQYWMSNFQIQFEYMQGDASQYWETWTWGTTTFDLGTGCTNYDNQGHSQTDFPGFYWTVGLPSECVIESDHAQDGATSSYQVSIEASSSDPSTPALATTATLLSIYTTEEYSVTTHFTTNSFELDDQSSGSILTTLPSGWEEVTTSSVAVESSLDAESRTRVTLSSSSTVASSISDHTSSTDPYTAVTAESSLDAESRTRVTLSSSSTIASSISDHAPPTIPYTSIDHTTTLETTTSSYPAISMTSEVSNSENTAIYSSSPPASSPVSLSSHSLDAMTNSATKTPTTPVDTSTMFTFQDPSSTPSHSLENSMTVTEVSNSLDVNSAPSVSSTCYTASFGSFTTVIVTKNQTTQKSSRSSLDARETSELSSSTTTKNSSSISIASLVTGSSQYYLSSVHMSASDPQIYSSGMTVNALTTPSTSTTAMPTHTEAVTASSNGIASSRVSSHSSLDARYTSVSSDTSGATTNSVSVPIKDHNISQPIELLSFSSSTLSRKPSSSLASSSQWTTVSNTSDNMSMTPHTAGDTVNSSPSTVIKDVPTATVTTTVATTKTETITSCSNGRCNTSVVTTTIGTVVTDTVYSCKNTLSTSSSNNKDEVSNTQTTTSHASHNIPSKHVAEYTTTISTTPNSPSEESATTKIMSRSTRIVTVDRNHSSNPTISHTTESGSTTTTLISSITPEAFINIVSSGAPYTTHSSITRISSSISSQSSNMPASQSTISSILQVYKYQDNCDKLIASVTWIISIICVLQVL
ncbi:hypothetical protein DAKH74_023280 [Maudiozyma humilis]|uniref:Flo11 domain-containing protein n=1 Tax=Maudiozyma humilis TaxID=51915 RepID=A0AAV5RWH3_MAUHU|nr:hypothetical protein DAKH74_023280 [Kazachstania humilis]